MKIIKEKTLYHTYALESDYSKPLVDFCQYLKSTLGWKEFSWDKDNKKWRFNDPSVILMLKEKFSALKLDSDLTDDLVEFQEKKKNDSETEKRAEEIKEQIFSSLKLKGIKGTLYEYQKIGIEFLINSGGRALLSDGPGVGKSVQALGFLTHSGHKRSLIVCPASVKFSWESEIEKWTNLTSFVVGSRTDLEDIPFDVNCVIINFDILKKFFNEFMKYKWDCLVVDESHLIKSATAQRTKVIKSLSKNIPNVIMLTGTPVLSRPIEMYNMLNIIDSKAWNNYYSYATRYCEGKQGYWGFEAKGASNLDELREKIGKYFLRRTKEEVLSELPPKNFIEVPMDLPKKERDEYNLVESNLIKFLKENKEKTDKEIVKSLQGEKLVKLNFLREINAMGKISTAIELIDSIIEAGEKVLVFSGFNAPLKELSTKYSSNSVMIIGETPIDDRGEIIKKFQEDNDTKIFFGGIKSAGTGITLTAASNVIFLDLPWTNADLQQSQDRAHRPGAIYESLNIYTIISRDSIDSFMKKLLKHKQEIVDQLIEKKKEDEKEESMVDEYIKELEEKYKK